MREHRLLTAMTRMGRETPEPPADILFSGIEIRALADFAGDRMLPARDNFGLAVLTMAIFGGYLDRKNDPWPGHEKVWEGYSRLTVNAQAYKKLIRMERSSRLNQRLRSDTTCEQGAECSHSILSAGAAVHWLVPAAFPFL